MVFLFFAHLALAASPQVVSSEPATGDVGVAAGLGEIIVNFDQPMAQESWSVVGGGRHFPRDGGTLGWRDPQTFVWQVRLRPDQDYFVSFNHVCCSGFASVAGQPATPFRLTFSTAPDPDARPRTRSNQRAVDRLRRILDEEDAHRDIAGVDWDERFLSFTPRLLAASSARSFARTAAELFSAVPDAHRWFTVRRWHYRTASASSTRIDLDIKHLKNTSGSVSHETAGGTAFLRVAEWDGGSRRAVPALIELLRNGADALVIDVRDNVGGDEGLAQKLAGCFVSEPVMYGLAHVRESGRWIGPVERILVPTPGCSFPASRTAILQGPLAASSNESFLLMMRAAGAVLVGETSVGSSGRPVRFRLGNGVTAWIPSWIDLAPDGSPIEGRGVIPDVMVEGLPANGRDEVLEAALATLRGR